MTVKKKQPPPAPPPPTFQEQVDESLAEVRRNKYRKLTPPERIQLLEEVLDTAIMFMRFAVVKKDQSGTGAMMNTIKGTIDAIMRLEERDRINRESVDTDATFDADGSATITIVHRRAPSPDDANADDHSE